MIDNPKTEPLATDNLVDELPDDVVEAVVEAEKTPKSIVESEDIESTSSDPVFALVPLTETGSFDSYVRSIRAAPVLTQQEEWELAKRLRDNNDLNAAQQLVFCNLRYVLIIAQTYSGYGLPLPDLVQEGNVGLMRAVKRYDPEKKVKLMTFATHWIRAEIHEFVIKNWRIVKMATTKAQRKLFFKLRSSRSTLDWMSDDEAQRIAKKLDVRVSDVYHMEGRLGQSDTAFDRSSDDDDDKNVAPADYLADSRYNPEQIAISEDNFEYHKQKMLSGIDKLDDRSKDIIMERWLSNNKSTLKDLAKKYSVSLERIRQIEAKALEKLKESIRGEEL